LLELLVIVTLLSLISVGIARRKNRPLARTGSTWRLVWRTRESLSGSQCGLGPSAHRNHGAERYAAHQSRDDGAV